MTKTAINRYRFRNLLVPTALLYRSIAVGIAGIVMLLIGLAASFRLVLRPVVGEFTTGWNRIVSGIAPGVSNEYTNHMLGGLLLVVGSYLTFRGFRGYHQRISGTENGNGASAMNSYVRKQQLARGPKIVAIGGGTGLSTLLRGLKQYSSNITAVVTVTDDGGSSGRLVQELGIIPPGDIRNCLVALADAEKRMTDLFQYRFTKGSGTLYGHSMGNLLIAGFVEQTGGDVDRALQMASEVLNIRGRVIPSTVDHVRLRALMENEEEILGETSIVAAQHRIRRIFLEPSRPTAHPEAIAAIKEADIICIGPGSVYTSVIPNLLVPGIPEALAESDAIKAYICNVMTQPGESDAFTAAEHLVAIQANVPKRVFDYVLVNTGTPTQAALDKYKEHQQDFVQPDVDRIRQMGYRPIQGNYMSETDYVRHDPARVAARLVDLLYK